jgi:hypothetical protein
MKMKNTHSNISITPQEIANMHHAFVKDKPWWCPFKDLVGQLNIITGRMTKDKMLPVQQIITKIYQTGGNLLWNVIKVLTWYDLEKLKLKNKYKVAKYLYDVLLLQEEVYAIIHDVLIASQQDWFGMSLNELSTLDLNNIEVRDKMLKSIHTYCAQTVSYDLLLRENIKSLFDTDFMMSQEIASQYSSLTKSMPLWFGTVFAQGVLDAIANVLCLLHNIPELYYEKNKKYPTTTEYREVLEKNMDAILLPLASLHLSSLVSGLRSDKSIKDSSISAALDMSPASHSLDENNIIVANQAYVTTAYQNMATYNKKRIAQERVLSSDDPYADFALRSWCPALKAKGSDGRPIIKRFFDDMLFILDKTYFPYWKQ